MRTVTIELKVRLSIRMDEDATTSDVIDELDYNFTDTTDKAQVENQVIEDYEVIDSK